MKFNKITVCLDMCGCPNRCKHCWVGATPNGNMPISELEAVAKEFRPFTDCFQIYDWYREPDFRDNYKELFSLCCKLSDKPIEHFELASFWRLVRDEEYAKWLSSLGVERVQLTLFGGERTTDFYVGRKGAYSEILRAIEILIENKISPRIQTFVNKNTVDELPHIENLIKELDLENRCRSFGGEFNFFLHQGSCDGENAKLYDIKVTPEDLTKIPAFLEEHTLRWLKEDSIADVFGQTEQSLYDELIDDRSTKSYVSDSPVFYIDKDFNVYPNITSPAPHWCLGNLKKDGAEAVLDNYLNSRSAAQRTRLNVPLCDIVKAQGNRIDRTSRRLFGREDYIEYLLNKYCE